MDISSVVLAAFFLGFGAGALIVVLQRERVIEKTRAEFEERLALTVSEGAGDRCPANPNVGEAGPRSAAAVASEVDGFDEEWMGLPAATATEAHHHRTRHYQ